MNNLIQDVKEPTYTEKLTEVIYRGLSTLRASETVKIEISYQTGDGLENMAVLRWSDRVQLTWVPF